MDWTECSQIHFSTRSWLLQKALSFSVLAVPRIFFTDRLEHMTTYCTQPSNTNATEHHCHNEATLPGNNRAAPTQQSNTHATPPYKLRHDNKMCTEMYMRVRCNNHPECQTEHFEQPELITDDCGCGQVTDREYFHRYEECFRCERWRELSEDQRQGLLQERGRLMGIQMREQREEEQRMREQRAWREWRLDEYGDLDQYGPLY